MPTERTAKDEDAKSCAELAKAICLQATYQRIRASNAPVSRAWVAKRYGTEV
jgi:hypothetical protein